MTDMMLNAELAWILANDGITAQQGRIMSDGWLDGDAMAADCIRELDTNRYCTDPRGTWETYAAPDNGAIAQYTEAAGDIAGATYATAYRKAFAARMLDAGRRKPRAKAA